MQASAMNLVPIGLVLLGFIIGLIIGLVKKPRKKWNWLWFSLLGMAAGLLFMILLGLVDYLIAI